MCTCTTPTYTSTTPSHTYTSTAPSHTYPSTTPSHTYPSTAPSHTLALSLLTTHPHTHPLTPHHKHTHSSAPSHPHHTRTHTPSTTHTPVRDRYDTERNRHADLKKTWELANQHFLVAQSRLEQQLYTVRQQLAMRNEKR